MPGSCYHGGFVRDSQKREEWLAEKTSFWTAAIGELAATARLFPQSVYTGLQCLLQQELQYVQQVIGDIPDSFTYVEEAIQDEFIPALFGNEQEALDCFPMLLVLLVKHAGITLPDPTISRQANSKASILVCSHLLAAFCGTVEFSTTDDLLICKEVFLELKKRKTDEYLEIFTFSVLTMPVDTQWTNHCPFHCQWHITFHPRVPGSSLSLVQ
jgi:hypothetical protein